MFQILSHHSDHTMPTLRPVTATCLSLKNTLFRCELFRWISYTIEPQFHESAHFTGLNWAKDQYRCSNLTPNNICIVYIY